MYICDKYGNGEKMASVREYLRFRRKRERPERSINYKERIRGHKLTIFYRGVLAVVLAAAVVGMIAVSWQNREYTEGIVISSIPVSRVEGSTYLALGNNILTYSKDVWTAEGLCCGIRLMRCRIP